MLRLQNKSTPLLLDVARWMFPSVFQPSSSPPTWTHTHVRVSVSSRPPTLVLISLPSNQSLLSLKYSLSSPTHIRPLSPGIYSMWWSYATAGWVKGFRWIGTTPGQARCGLQHCCPISLDYTPPLSKASLHTFLVFSHSTVPPQLHFNLPCAPMSRAGGLNWREVGRN